MTRISSPRHPAHQAEPPSGALPSRHTLTSSTVDILRASILGGEWRDFLPGERYLCQHLLISRPTLRAALETLQREGLVSIAHRHRTRILGNPSLAEPRIGKVIVLTPQSVQEMSPLGQHCCSELFKCLRATELDFLVINDPVLSRKRPYKSLERHRRQHPNAAWVLFRASQSVQKWFHANQLPTIIVGSSYPDCLLPSLDQDHRATCRHAAGHLLRLDHQKLALIVQESKLAGDLASEEGFLEAVHQHAGSRASGLILRHNGTKDDLRKRIIKMLDQPQHPTGLIVCGANHLLGILPHLYRAGKHIPEDISLVCRDNESYLDYLGLPVTRYIMDLNGYIRRLSRLVLKLCQEGTLPPKAHLNHPVFFQGESTARMR